METKKIIALMFLLFVFTRGFAKKKTGKQLREEAKIKKLKKMAF